MIFCFDGETAKRYGVDCAILIQNLQFWILKNKANNKHFHEDRTWTYNSQEAFTKLFPFWSRDQIKRILKKLQDAEVILKGRFNKNPFDSTQWYAFKNEDIFLTSGGTGSPSQIGRNRPALRARASDTDINTDIQSPLPPSQEFPSWLSSETWESFREHRRKIKKPMTAYAEKLMLKKLTNLKAEGHDPLKLLEETIMNGWQGIVVPKQILQDRPDPDAPPPKYSDNQKRFLNPDFVAWEAKQEINAKRNQSTGKDGGKPSLQQLLETDHG